MNENFNGFRMPAEWEPQNSVWIAWPYNKNDWPGLYQFIPEVVLEIIKKISKNQKVNLIVSKNIKNIKKLIKLNKIKNITGISILNIEVKRFATSLVFLSCI